MVHIMGANNVSDLQNVIVKDALSRSKTVIFSSLDGQQSCQSLTIMVSMLPKENEKYFLLLK